MLDTQALNKLSKEKNLLAFSAGIDSSALFFLLVHAKIDFDLAIVNYHTRQSSDAEVAYAQKLASEYNKKLFIHDATLDPSAYEANARKIRYYFFDGIIREYHYTMLLTAHQLNDQLEWFLMQFSKGAGTLELLGMKTFIQREHYTVCRPLLQQSKDDLLHFLKENKYHYFVDASNEDEKFKRNFIRHNFSDKFLSLYKEGVQKSFTYLQEDEALILGEYEVKQIQELILIHTPLKRTQLYLIDKALKRLGYILSASQREEIKLESSLVIGGKYAIESLEDCVYIAPIIEEPPSMPKVFKEACRVAKVPLKIRAFLFDRGIAIDQL